MIASNSLDLEIKPVGNAEPLRVQGDISYSSLAISVMGDGWSRTAKMENELEFEARLARIKTAMQAAAGH